MLAVVLVWWGLSIDWAVGVRSMARLRPAPPEVVPGPASGGATPTPRRGGGPPAAAPSVSVVVPARNEAGTLERALRSLMAQDLPDLEIVVVDDRSEDATGAIAVRVAAGDARVRVITVESLPEGWLGKPHALHVGAAAARAPWLLFADADVRFAPSAVRVALAYARARALDHLAVLPRFESSGLLLASFVTAFALLFSVYTRPWRARVPGSSASIGIGAFGLVRAVAYRASGGHRAIRLRPDDDLMLGRQLKRAGYRQEAVFGAELLAVEWYPSLPAALRGLEKNAFAGLGYSAPRVLLVVTALLLTNVLPFAVALVAQGPALALAWLVVATVAAVYAFDARRLSHAWWLFALHPVGVALLCYAAGASATKALVRGEIVWRGTRYRLEELRRQPPPGP